MQQQPDAEPTRLTRLAPGEMATSLPHLEDVRLEVSRRMNAIQQQNTDLREQIAALDAQRNQLAIASQQQQGAYNALKDLLDALPGG